MAGGPFVLANGLQINGGAGGENVTFQFDSLAAQGNPGIEIQNSGGLPGFGGSTEDIVITGAISGSGTYALMSVDPSDAGTLAGLLPNGTYGQLGYGFSLSQSLPNRANGSLVVNGAELDLVVSGLYSVAWTGLNGSSWNAINNFQQMGGVDSSDKFQTGDAVVFSDSAAGFLLNVNAGNVAPSSMTFQNTLHAYTITGTASITGNTGLSLTNSGMVIIENTDTFSGLTSIGPGSTLQLGNSAAGPDGQLTNSPISDNGALIYSLTGQQTVANPITGTGTVQLASGGVTLTSTGNTFGGGLTISGGTLQIGNNSGAGFDGSLPGQVLDNSLLIFANYAPQTFSGTIGGSGAVTKSGLGQLTMITANSYSGSTTISGGTLVLGNGQPGNDASLSPLGGVNDNAVLAFNYAANETFAGLIGGNGALATLGSRTLTLTNIETYSGPTTVSAGTLQLGNGVTSGAVAGNIVNNSALIFNSPTAQTYSGIISGSGSIATIGGNYLALAGKSTNSGPVMLSGGTLSLVGGSLYSNLGWGNQVITVANGGEVVVAAWSDTDSSGNNGGFGQLSFTGSNLVLNGGTIRYVGTTTAGGNWDRGFTIGPNGATLDASGAVTFQLNAATGSRLGNGYGLITNAANGPLTLEGTTNGSLGLAYSGAGNLTKNGPGTWTISGSNTYSGGTTVNAGMLIAANTGACPGIRRPEISSSTPAPR